MVRAVCNVTPQNAYPFFETRDMTRDRNKVISAFQKIDRIDQDIYSCINSCDQIYCK